MSVANDGRGPITLTDYERGVAPITGQHHVDLLVDQVLGVMTRYEGALLVAGMEREAKQVLALKCELRRLLEEATWPAENEAPAADPTLEERVRDLENRLDRHEEYELEQREQRDLS